MSQKILITGASSGFGRGTALELARQGHHVIATGETWPQVRALRADAADAGVTLEVIKLNLLDTSISSTRDHSMSMCWYSTLG